MSTPFNVQVCISFCPNLHKWDLFKLGGIMAVQTWVARKIWFCKSAQTHSSKSALYHGYQKIRYIMRGTFFQADSKNNNVELFDDSLPHSVQTWSSRYI